MFLDEWDRLHEETNVLGRYVRFISSRDKIFIFHIVSDISDLNAMLSKSSRFDESQGPTAIHSSKSVDHPGGWDSYHALPAPEIREGGNSGEAVCNFVYGG